MEDNEKKLEEEQNVEVHVEEESVDNTEVSTEDSVEEKVEEPVNDMEKPVEEKAEEVKPEKKSKAKIVIIIILLLVILGCCYFIFFKKDTKSTTTGTDVKEVKSEYRMSGNSLENFDLYFMKLENNGKNQVYSPLSIKYALEMLAEGAKGNTKAELDAVIGDYKANKYTNSKNMSFANAMFIRNTFKSSVKKEYTDLLKDKYNAEVIYDSFTTPNNINNWVSNKTFKLINNLIDDASENDFFLINALAIDMDWVHQINCASGSKVPCKTHSIYYNHEKLDEDATSSYNVTSPYYLNDEEFPRIKFNNKTKVPTSDVMADFNRYDIIKELGEKKIKDTVRPEYKKWLAEQEKEHGSSLGEDVEKNVEKYLDQFVDEIKSNYNKGGYSTDCYVYEDDSLRSFAKNLKEYNGTTLQYVGIMPKDGNLTDYVKNVSADDINKVISNLKSMKIENFKEGVATRIRGNIPFFKFDYELQLKEDLEKLDIKDVFDMGKADLSNLSTGSVAINKAIHKATIEFSNDGIKAAAATAEGGLGAAGGGFDYQFKIPVEEIDVTFDKPYMYLIRDKKTGEVWFAGTVYEPRTTVR